MWLIPDRNRKSAAVLTCESGTWKCSPSQVNDSDDARLRPLRCAAEAANFIIGTIRSE